MQRTGPKRGSEADGTLFNKVKGDGGWSGVRLKVNVSEVTILRDEGRFDRTKKKEEVRYYGSRESDTKFSFFWSTGISVSIVCNFSSPSPPLAFSPSDTKMFPPTSSSSPCSHNNVSLPLLRCKKNLLLFFSFKSASLSNQVPLCPSFSPDTLGHCVPVQQQLRSPPAPATLCVFDMISSPLQQSDPDF